MKNKLIIFLFCLISILLLACNSKKTTIKFETFGGNEISNIVVNDINDFKLPTNPEKDGYIFKGWYLEEDYKTEFVSLNNLSGNITLYAKWEKVNDKSLDEKINEYYRECLDYKNSFSYIYLEFDSKEEAKQVLNQYGVDYDSSDDAWVYVDEFSDKMNIYDVVNIFIKIYNDRNEEQILEGVNYTVLNTDESFDLLKEIINEINIIVKYDIAIDNLYQKIDRINELLSQCKDILNDIDEKFINTEYNSSKVINIIEEIKSKLNSSTDTNIISNITKGLKDLHDVFYYLDGDTIVFNVDSFKVYTYKEIFENNKVLARKLQNTFVTYKAYHNDADLASRNSKVVCYNYYPISSDDGKFFYVLKIRNINGPSLDEV